MWNSNTGTWNTSHILSEERNAHTSWTPDSRGGTHLIGGSASPSTTDIVKKDEGVSSGFHLKYEARLFIDLSIIEKFSKQATSQSHNSKSQPIKGKP